MDIVWETNERIDWSSFDRDACILGECVCGIEYREGVEYHIIPSI